MSLYQTFFVTKTKKVGLVFEPSRNVHVIKSYKIFRFYCFNFFNHDLDAFENVDGHLYSREFKLALRAVIPSSLFWRRSKNYVQNEFFSGFQVDNAVSGWKENLQP